MPTVSLDLRDYFLSANILGYTVSDPGVIGVSLQGGVMQIKGLRKGEATVIVSDGAAHPQAGRSDRRMTYSLTQ